MCRIVAAAAVALLLTGMPPPVAGVRAARMKTATGAASAAEIGRLRRTSRDVMGSLADLLDLVGTPMALTIPAARLRLEQAADSIEADMDPMAALLMRDYARRAPIGDVLAQLRQTPRDWQLPVGEVEPSAVGAVQMMEEDEDEQEEEEEGRFDGRQRAVISQSTQVNTDAQGNVVMHTTSCKKGNCTTSSKVVKRNLTSTNAVLGALNGTTEGLDAGIVNDVFDGMLNDTAEVWSNESNSPVARFMDAAKVLGGELKQMFERSGLPAVFDAMQRSLDSPGGQQEELVPDFGRFPWSDAVLGVPDLDVGDHPITSSVKSSGAPGEHATSEVTRCEQGHCVKQTVVEWDEDEDVAA